jgi:tetratricopeptide (TPR) repeat protein
MPSVELFNVPVSLIHENDDEPDLLIALQGYDKQNWDLAKIQLEPIARTGNRLALFKFANTLDNLGDLEAAEHFWRIAVAGGDTNAGINLANLYKDQGRNHDEIIQLYMQGINAGNVDAIRNLALYVEDDDPEWAEGLYLRAVEEGDAKSCANLALNRFSEDNVEEALRFAELGYQRGNMYSVTVIALHHMHREEWELAIAESRRALTLSTDKNVADQKHPYKLIALGLIQLFRFDEAQKAIQDCYDQNVPETDELSDFLDMMRDSQEENTWTQTGHRPNFCTSCGNKVQADNLFCSSCGNKL